MKKLIQTKTLKPGQSLQEICDYFDMKNISLKDVVINMNSWNILELNYTINISNKGNIIKYE